MTTTFRGTAEGPPWFRAYVASRYLYAVRVQLDALADDAVSGIRQRFPATATDDALALIGRDRGIAQGPNEPTASYVVRLERWIDDWKQAGSAYSVMSQVQGYLTPNAQTLRIVNNAGFWYTLAPDGTRTYHKSSSSNWNWDADAASWSRFWLIIYCNAGLPFGISPRWGDAGAKWGVPNTTWGTSATPSDVASIRGIVQQWKSAHSKCERIIIAFDPASFDPASASGPPMPDGTWAHNSTGVPPGAKARLATARYWKGSD